MFVNLNERVYLNADRITRIKIDEVQDGIRVRFYEGQNQVAKSHKFENVEHDMILVKFIESDKCDSVLFLNALDALHVRKNPIIIEQLKQEDSSRVQKCRKVLYRLFEVFRCKEMGKRIAETENGVVFLLGTIRQVKKA